MSLLALASCDKIPGSSPKLSSEKDSLSYAIGLNLGRQLKSGGIDTLANREILQQTVEAVLKGDSMQMTDQQAQTFLQGYFQKFQVKQMEASQKEGQKYLESNKSKAGVKTTGSGLQYMVMKEGNGAQPKATDSVTVHYLGTLTSGKKFDSSYDQGQPVTFKLNEVIPGWTEGVQLMKVGSKYKFFIPPNLGYGPQGNQMIPPNSVLVFEVELLNVKPSAGGAEAVQGGK